MVAVTLGGGWLMRVTAPDLATIPAAVRLQQGLRACRYGSRRLRTWLMLETWLTWALAGLLALLIVDAWCTVPGWARAVVLLVVGSLAGLGLWDVWRECRSPLP